MNQGESIGIVGSWSSVTVNENSDIEWKSIRKERKDRNCMENIGSILDIMNRVPFEIKESLNLIS